MSISGFFAAMRNKVLAPPTQHDLAIKAMTKVAEGAHRKLYGPRASKRNLHIGQISEIGWTKHRLPPRKEVRLTKRVKVFYQAMVNTSRYPFAHSYGGRHPGWLTRGVK